MSSVNMISKPAHFTFASGVGRKLGIFAALFTVIIWSSFFLAMRAGATSTLSSFDLAILRFGLASLVLLPFVIKDWSKIRATSKRLLAGIIVGAGLPFFFLCSIGMSYAPASHAGLIITGTTPVFVSLVAVLFFKETLSKQKIFGLACIAIGVVALLALAFVGVNSEYLKGDLVLLLAAACWAMFSVLLRMAGLPPLSIAGFLSLVSTVVLILLYVFDVVRSGLSGASTELIAAQVMAQSIGVGLLAAFSYGYAINKIGAESSAAIGSLTPVVVGVLAVPILGESLTTASIIGMILVFIGVLLSSGISLSVFSLGGDLQTSKPKTN